MRGVAEFVAAGGFTAILYAEDFDDHPAEDAASAVEPLAEPPPPPITEADVAAACADAVQAARLEWQAEHDQARLAALAALTPALANLHATAEQQALSVAEGTATTMLAMLNALLPQFCREHGPAEARALLAHLLPTIRAPGRISVRVHADLVDLIQRDVDALDPALAATIDVIAAPIGRADVRVGWENGALHRDAKQIRESIEDALNQLGLRGTAEAPAKRSLAYAD